MIKAPCKNCDSRFVGCHSKCEKYLEYKSVIDNVREKRLQQTEIDRTFVDHYKRLNKRLSRNKKR